jgi:hypothetical protein
MLADAPLTSLICFFPPDPSHVSGFRLILQLVSDRLAARRVVHVPLLLRCVLLATRAGMCSFDWSALFSFAQPHTCIWIPPDSAAREWLPCCSPCGACYVPWVVSTLLLLCPCCSDVWPATHDDMWPSD